MSDPQPDFRERYGGAALVTGASAGIGETFCHALAERKMDLVLVARRKGKLNELAEELARKHEIRVDVIAQDLGTSDGPALVKKAVDELDIDIGLLVNNAGYGTHGDFVEQDVEREAAMVDLNCRAPLVLTHLFLPRMVTRGKGGLIFTASMAGFQPTPYLACYGATKAFDLMLAESLWAELKGSGIDVLALCPGVTPTEFQEIANVKSLGPAIAMTTREEVVEAALAAFGKKPTVVPGVVNKVLNLSVRFGSRARVAQMSGYFAKPRDGADD